MLSNSIFESKRNSHVTIGEIIFWTATINSWQKLLTGTAYKDIIINSFTYLSDKGLVDVFGFVIMPNHIHLIWRVNKLNGKEYPHASLLKYTAHAFKKSLKATNLSALASYAVDAKNKQYEFWQRDALAIPLLSREMAYQKLEYIHNNPLAEHWQLATLPEEYYYSSAGFYERHSSPYSFLKDLRNEF